MIDCYYCELQSDINVAEFGEITSEQAWFLREKYLGLSRKDNSDYDIESEQEEEAEMEL